MYISNYSGSGAKREALTHLRQEAPVQFHVICNCCDASTWALGGLHRPPQEREGQGRGCLCNCVVVLLMGDVYLI